jgi:hypothetical protein
MPAPDIKTLYKFESSIEPAIQSALVSAGFPSGSVYLARGATTLITPSASVLLRVGGNNGHRFKPPTLSYWVFDQWRCALDIMVRTNRTKDAAALSHDDYRAIVRMVMPDVFSRVNALLTYHAFAEAFMEQSSNTAQDSENNHDITDISFSSVLAIKRDAWPTE